MLETDSNKRFEELSIDNLVEILGYTIKRDKTNKVITFLSMLSAYTHNDQFNISFNAPSSTGKSYIPLEVSKFFPSQDVLKLSHCSPAAFFHDAGTYNEENNEIMVDLYRKIIIFMDQPETTLLTRLRSLLSHDERTIKSKITDKSQKYGFRTKNVSILGFPSVIFCSTGLNIDEQEATRFILLSPDIDQAKIRQGIETIIDREVDTKKYSQWLDEIPERAELNERIIQIAEANIMGINIKNAKVIKEHLLYNNKSLKPRDQRDAKRIISIIKSVALLNLWHRDLKDNVITANDEDIRQGFELWKDISDSQEKNLSPYTLEVYRDVICMAYIEKYGEKANDASGIEGLTIKEILTQHVYVYNRPINTNYLNRHVLNQLEASGLIIREKNPVDRREQLIIPTEIKKPKL